MPSSSTHGTPKLPLSDLAISPFVCIHQHGERGYFLKCLYENTNSRHLRSAIGINFRHIDTNNLSAATQYLLAP